MQLVGSPEDANDDARRTMGKTAVAGREVARKLGIPVIGISSCARAHYKMLDGTATKEDKIEPLGQGNARRLLAVAKESGDVEYASDSVLVIGRNAPNDPSEKPLPCDAWLGIAKGRSGAGGWVKFSWNGTAYSSPEDAREDAPPESGTQSIDSQEKIVKRARVKR
jgi:replicative DNA helicase